MLDLFNELMECFRLLVQAFLYRIEFIPGLGYGWVVVAIIITGMIIYFLFGRTK